MQLIYRNLFSTKNGLGMKPIKTILIYLIPFMILHSSCSLENTDQPTGCIGGMILEAVQLEPATCGGMDGSVKILVRDNIGEPVYQLDGTRTQRFGTFDSLAAGSYKVVVSDDVGCVSEVEAIITTGLTLTDAIPIIATHCTAGCHDGTDATIPLDFKKENVVLGNVDLILTQLSDQGLHDQSVLDLEEPDFELLKCWISDGAPE